MTLENKIYPLAPNGIFRTVQGEGALLGVPMNFVRLAGCSIGCVGCDTDYRVAERITATEIGRRLDDLGRCDWTWVTGGEPADHDLWPLFEVLRLRGRIAVATSGHEHLGSPAGSMVDFLSVSPHGLPRDMLVDSGSQLNLVHGLNGLELRNWRDRDWRYNGRRGFNHLFVTPMWGDDNSLQQSIRFVQENPGWRLGIQAHRHWGIP